ncbi:nitronate monooxygenase/enoyl-[acyl-carrier protein] reductase II [Kribbella sp. VKM Ac-2527]|uniref:Nitronate monooxygenase/enoyl-[acyl-carrier protein] reductase II n=1 Tax=Kribbella caucasensis TaxID=2512215 RepID=A0A4R6J3S7_9ACTN|nr:nitronate monooxygenase [Kribbella sp. VKM Ac-2527]TDO30014.1 nitronate monooxygenase/enoyl-[acyl-carrier protein] reductase II [Kribbella sp. VKM Ac-2527]
MHTGICDLLGIEVPIVLAPFGPWEQVELAAAVCEAGGLGSVGTAVLPTAQLTAQWKQLKSLTDRPFAINHTGRPFNEEAFAASLDVRPAAISFHLGVPADLIKRAHDHGIPWLQLVGDVTAAEAALEAGADVLVAQGTEAGGNAGSITTMVLVPAVVDIAGEVPVLAAGGIADGRGLAAALALGAQGAWIGTRFLATVEMAASQRWKDQIVASGALDARKVLNSEVAMPPYTLPQVGAPMSPRALPSEFIDRLARDPDSIDESDRTRLLQLVRSGRGDELLPLSGQSVELIHDIVPARVLVERIVAEADEILARLGSV